jgi:predicted type IV restriction endonuclease
MDFPQRVKDLAQRSRHATELALTEEATKTAVIFPFIQALGFDVFNLNEVTPEFVADVGTKKGEKIDFALKIDGKPAILVEAKPISMSLGSAQYSQLYRYFGVVDARLAILTNGREIWFFSDIDEKNKMDKKPFFIFDLQSFDEAQVKDLARFHKSVFNIDEILETASNLKFVKAASEFLKGQMAAPSEEFVRLIAKHIVGGTITKNVVEQIRPVIPKALDDMIRDRIQDKLNIAFRPDAPVSPEVHAGAISAEDKFEVVTTDDETQAYFIVKAIGAKILPISRIGMRDAKSYCSIIVDDNNRKPVCRFYFNSKNVRHIGIFDSDKVETRIQINDLSEIFGHATSIEKVLASYLK